MSDADPKPPILPQRTPAPDEGFDAARWNALAARLDAAPEETLREADRALRKEIHALINRLSSLQSRLQRRWDGDDEADVAEHRRCLAEYRALARDVAQMAPKR